MDNRRQESTKLGLRSSPLRDGFSIFDVAFTPLSTDSSRLSLGVRFLVRGPILPR
jgi:hypothetical protein